MGHLLKDFTPRVQLLEDGAELADFARELAQELNPPRRLTFPPHHHAAVWCGR